MMFRTRIFAVILASGLLPAVMLLLASAYLLNSTLDKIGATGLESSIKAARSMVDDAERRIASLLESHLDGNIPWESPDSLRDWRESRGLALVFKKSGDRVNWSCADSLDFIEGDIRDFHAAGGLQHLEIRGNAVLLVSRADPDDTSGCGIIMPGGYIERGWRLSGASSASASLSIYKKFSLQLLTAITGAALIVVLFTGFILSRIISGKLVKPLTKLTDGARKLGAGDLGHRIDLSGNDEFARLAGSFNEMASEISENQERLLQAERLAAWREVARRIAHEIKNPLTPITVQLYRLKSRMLNPVEEKSDDMAEALDAIDRQIRVLQDLAGHFSAFAKEPKIRTQKCSAADILKRTIALYKDHQHIAIISSIPDNLPPVEIDPEMMGRVFANILKNSIEASPDSVRIHVHMEAQENGLKIVIRDDGPGFPPEILSNIDTAYITTKKGGTGLGLAIIRKIIDEHGGGLKIYNSGGAVVEISIPKSR